MNDLRRIVVECTRRFADVHRALMAIVNEQKTITIFSAADIQAFPVSAA